MKAYENHVHLVTPFTKQVNICNFFQKIMFDFLCKVLECYLQSDIHILLLDITQDELK